MAIFKTVGELRAALADVADDTPLAMSAQHEGWKIGLDAGMLEVQTLGSGDDQLLVATSNEFWKKMKVAKRGTPFKVVAFD